MALNIFVLICSLVILCGSEITKCELPDRIRTIESNDIDSLPDVFSFYIEKIKLIIHQFRCPEGWKRLGGSCYYLSNFTSTSSLVNHTCHHLHSNSSRLMKVQNGFEFLYAARVLTQNNLSMLMIEIDSHVLKRKSLAEMISNDRNKWSEIRKKIIDQRNQSQNTARNIINQLKRNGFSVARRSRKSNLNGTMTNTTAIAQLDQYEYDELSLPDDIDEFEQMENMHKICDDIHWNVYDFTSNATTYILTKYGVSNRTICSLSDVEIHTKYPHVCEYILDYCIANVLCGEHGRCEKTLAGFKCACWFLYGGLLCEKISREGWEIILSFSVTVIVGVVNRLLSLCICDKPKKRCQLLKNVRSPCSKTSKAIYKTFRQLRKREQKNQSAAAPASPMKNYKSIRLKLIWILTPIILAGILLSIAVIYQRRFEIDMNGEVTLRNASRSVINLIEECKLFERDELTYLVMVLLAVILSCYFFCLGNRHKKKCGIFGTVSLMEPFRTNNRVIITMVFASLAYEVLKTVEAVTFSLSDQLSAGIFTQLLYRVGMIAITSGSYYPILLSLQFKNHFARCVTCPYMIFFIGAKIIREGSCVGYLPLSGPKALLEEAKLRLELGTWFIIYGFVKYIPQFFCLSYITAELLVRWLYDTIYVTTIKKQGALLANNEQALDMKCALIYTQKLFKRQNRTENEEDRSRVKGLCDKIYKWDDEFCFSTMVLSTFTVAGIFLYYLVCSFVFVYISRTTGHITFLKSYIKSRINTNKTEEVSLRTEIISSAVITGLLYGIQLLVGLKQFREDKKKLYRPTRKERELSFQKIASEAVHFPGLFIVNMAWGFVITFHLILLLAIALRMILSQVPDAVIALNIIVPALTLYAFRKTYMHRLEKYIFRKKEGGNENTQEEYPNTTRYANLTYYCFFVDCFLGITSCLIRLIKATILNILFIGRLDWNFLSRPLERWDSANNAYRSYLQMEVDHSHPILLAFSYSCFKRINKRPRLYHDDDDDDCCIATDQYTEDGSHFEENGTNSYAKRCERPRPNDE